MTRVRITREDKTLTLIVAEHATGSPEVCAAASILCYTLRAWLEQNGVRHTALLSPGQAFVECDRTDASALCFDVIASGFLLLARDFSPYISVKVQKT